MQIKNSEKIFKLEITHELNKPMMFKVWANSEIKKLELENQQLDYIKKSVVDKRFISHFSLNKNYKGQLRSEIKDFVQVGLNFVPDYIVHDDRVELVEKSGQEYVFDEQNITKIEYKSSNYKKLNLSFNAIWQHLYVDFYSNSGKITSYNFEQLKKNMPLCSDYKGVRILHSKLYLLDNIWKVGNNNLYKIAICNYNLQFLYYVPILRNELITFSSQISNTSSNAATKNIEYTIKIPYRPAIKDWCANKSYRLFDIVSFNGKTYEAIKDNKQSDFHDSDWKKINLTKHLSFNNASSFFSTNYGNKIFEKIKSAIPMQIEKNVSDTIFLCLVNSEIPKLNDFFKYKNQIFRIISLSVHQGTHEFIEIVGQEILNSNIESSNDYFSDDADYLQNIDDYFSQLNWEHDGYITRPEIYIHNASTEDFSHEQFEGIEIRIPSEASISSKCDVNINIKDRSEK